MVLMRILFGFAVVFGAVGTIEIDPDADLAIQFMLAFSGLLLMFSGIMEINQNRDDA
jgi:4-hydroxybenzoate polyprenyltransferase